MESAQKATIFGVHLDDKLLFPHTPGMGWALDHRRGDRGDQRDHDVHDRPADLEARSHADHVDPDNPMAQSQKYMMYIVPFFSLTGCTGSTGWCCTG